MAAAVDTDNLGRSFPPLDDTLYKIDDQALQFMREQTGIQDEEALKKHILSVQAEAYAVGPARMEHSSS